MGSFTVEVRLKDMEPFQNLVAILKDIVDDPALPKELKEKYEGRISNELLQLSKETE
jgi:hypothetical protein